MNTNQIHPTVERNSSFDSNLSGFQVIYKYPEAEYIMASGGSSQVLGDFLEFTDYLVVENRITRHGKTEEFYTAFTGF